MPAIIIPENPELVMAYDRINQFYENWALPDARRYLYKFIKAAHADKAARFRVPNFLYFREELEELINAALCLHYAGTEHPAVLLDPESSAPDITCFHQYCNHCFQLKAWHYFPRSLNRKEYANPYKVFSRLAKFGNEQAWKKILNDLFYYCYSPNSFSELVKSPDILRLSTCMQKLLEATHLIVVRGIHEKVDRKECSSDDKTGQNKEQNNELHNAPQPAPLPAVNEELDKQQTPDQCQENEQVYWQVIKDFFQCWAPEDFEKDSWNMTKKALTNELDEMEASERDTIILVFEKLKELIPAVHALYQTQFTKSKQPS